MKRALHQHHQEEEGEGGAVKRARGAEDRWAACKPVLRAVAAVCYAMGVPGYRDIAGVIRDMVGPMTRCLYCHRPGPHAKQCRYGPVCAQCYGAIGRTPERYGCHAVTFDGRTACNFCELDMTGHQGLAEFLCPTHFQPEGFVGPVRQIDGEECHVCDRACRGMFVVFQCFPCYMGYFRALADPWKVVRHLGRAGLSEDDGRHHRLTFRRFLLGKMHPTKTLTEYAERELFDGSDWEARPPEDDDSPPSSPPFSVTSPSYTPDD